MKKELPSKFRFSVYASSYYIAELATQADTYNLSTTDSEGKDVCNLNYKVLKERAEEFVNSGYWEIIEESFELPSKFTFKVGETATYTAIEQEDKSYVVWFENKYKYEYSRDIVEKHVKQGEWVIQKEVEAVLTQEPTLLDVIKEFVDSIKSEVTILPQGKWNVSCSFLSEDIVVDNEDELKQLLAAISSIIKMAVGKMANGKK